MTGQALFVGFDSLSDRVRLIDVGARGGIDRRWQPYHHLVDVLGFEPDERECQRLSEASHPYQIRFLPAALGENDGESAVLRLCKSPGSSSLLKPNRELCDLFPYGAASEVVGEIDVTLRRMDSVVVDFQPDIIKIDTQGTELAILCGAGKLLNETLAVEIEVEFSPLYHDQPLFADVDSFMRQQGFTLQGLRRTLWRRNANHSHPYGGRLVHGDAFYVRHEKMDSFAGHVILAAYRQYDFLSALGQDKWIPKRSITQRIGSRLISRFSHRGLRRRLDEMRPPTATDWHDPDFF